MAGEKRIQDQEETLLSETVILVDIEGTTTSISFVKDNLFPYVRDNLKNYIESKWEDEEFKQDFKKLEEQAKKDEENKVDGLIPITGTSEKEQRESLIKNILWQMDCDRKTGSLKQLQGHMWREAYNSGAIKAHVYDDVPKAFESWTNDGRKVYVYSSGSVEAQKLLFEHTVYGDLLKYISGYFDTEVGAKQESSSYQNILNKIGVQPSNVIFLTDVVKEAAAAKEAGIATAIVLREGNAALTDEEKVAFTTIKSFLDLTFQSSMKRQKLETTNIQDNTSKSASDIIEPMDTSEDIEMSDVSEKVVNKVETEEATQKEIKQSVKDQLSKDAKISNVKIEEPKFSDIKDASDSKKVMETVVFKKVEVQRPEVSTKLDASENVKPVVSDNTDTTLTCAKNDLSKPVVSESVEKCGDVADKIVVDPKSEATVTTSNLVGAGACEPKSKSGEVAITEKKTEEGTSIIKETKSEDAKVSNVKTVEDTLQEKDCNKSIDEKSEEHNKTSEECTKKSEKCTEKLEECSKTSEECSKKSEECSKKSEECTKKLEKQTNEEFTDKGIINSSKADAKKLENEKSLDASTLECTKIEEKFSENGDVSLTNVEKEKIVSTITESEAANNKSDVNVELKGATDVVIETKTEMETESTNEKSAKVKGTEEVAPIPITDVEQHEVSVESKQELTDKSAKEESVAEAKETNTVDSEKKKLNGTTQNGETDISVSDDKLHRNGLNEGSSNENINSSTNESTSAQNGEPESSSDASADSIKLKKVVDSTIADGAGEPDVVPPVVVAATS